MLGIALAAARLHARGCPAQVCGDDMRWLDTYEDSQAIKNKKERRRFRKSMWPPNAGGYADGDGDAARVLDQLHRCCRIVPHYADTGGFFVAILRKVAPFPEEDGACSARAPPAAASWASVDASCLARPAPLPERLPRAEPGTQCGSAAPPPMGGVDHTSSQSLPTVRCLVAGVFL